VKFFKRNRNLGTWTVFATADCFKWYSVYIGGTTPTNADHWTINVQLGNFEFYMSFGRHFSIDMGNIRKKNQKYVWLMRNCGQKSCYTNQVTQEFDKGYDYVLRWNDHVKHGRF